MHHFLYPTKDSYISNKSSEKDLNFGLDEMLILGVSHSIDKVFNSTKTYHYSNEFVAGVNVQNFVGNFTGSFFGTVYDTSGSIIGSLNKFTSSYFIGDVSGSINGLDNGVPILNTNYSGSLSQFSGNLDCYTVNGYITGSLIANCFDRYTGRFSTAIGNLSGYLTGDEIKQEVYITTAYRSYINRSLIQFDLTFISQSISSGDIISPKFYLKLKSTEARELPVNFTIFAFPVSGSWEQGDGYFSDGGSLNGVSWDYKDSYSGSSWWTTPYTEDIITSSIDYLQNYSLVSESFKRGGGTWYNIPCSQSFNFEVSDINMDVTSIVNSWLSNSIPNNGFILMYGGEVSLSASNAHMFFFSNQTNTIYNPKLDIRWDDSEFITGSFGTGSVFIVSYPPRISGSMVSPIEISNLYVTGSFNATSYINLNNNYEVIYPSLLSGVGVSGTVKGMRIEGLLTGTSSYEDVSGSYYITASFTQGDFESCSVLFKHSGSMSEGIISGSFNQRLFLDHIITGSITDSNHIFISNAHEFSPAQGDLIGVVGSNTGSSYAVFNGVVTTGPLKGANVSIPFSGSYAYLTSSVFLTSSIEITSSALRPVDINKPFVVIVQDLKKEYSFGDFPRIGVFGREHFPLKTFGKSPQQLSYITLNYLPSSSYYSIKDNETEEIIIDFDDYTKISCDRSGNYFYLDTTGLNQERYYRILIRVNSDNKQYTFDSRDLFKIVR